MNPTQTPDTVADLVAGIDHLPSLGDVHRELATALDDEGHTAGRVSSIIAHDVGLTAELFRLVNSASFGLGARIESLPQAVAFLGTDNLRSLVAANALMQADDRTDPCRIRSLNEHRLATGALAAFVRRSRGGCGLDGAVEAADVLHGDHDAIRPIVERLADEFAPTPDLAAGAA